jgi:hypothetical protein
MSKVRAPRKPKDEDLAVTVSNQDKQIKLLIDRVEGLIAENGALKSDKANLLHRCQKVSELEEKDAYNRGYIARVKEADDKMFGPPL